MPDPSIAKRLLEFSRLFAAGEYASALALVDQLAADNPNEGPIHWQRARTLEKLERYDEARAAVKRVLELRHEFAPAWVMRAELGEEEGDYDPEPDLRRAIALDPKLGRARYALALLLHGDEGKDEESRAQMDTAIELDPSLHEAFAARGGWSRIEAWTDQAPEGEEGEGVFRTFSGLRIKRAHLERALADFDRAIAVKPLPNYRFARADLLHSLQRFDEALAELDGLLAELAPEHPLRSLAVDARKRSENQGAGEREMRSGKTLPEAPSGYVPDSSEDTAAVSIARRILQMAQEAAPQYVPANPAEYPRHQRGFEKRATRRLAKLGFSKLGDYDPVHLAVTPARKQMLSLYVRENGEATAAAFSIKPDWPGLAAWLLMAVKGLHRATEVTEFETTFSDGTMISTNNAGSLGAFNYGPAFLQEKLARGTAVERLYEVHVARVKAHAAAHSGTAIRRVRTLEELALRQAEVREKLALVAEQAEATAGS